MSSSKPYTKACKQCGQQIVMAIDGLTGGWRPWDNLNSAQVHVCGGGSSQTQDRQQYQGADNSIKRPTSARASTTLQPADMVDAVMTIKHDVEICKQHLETLVKKAAMFERAESIASDADVVKRPPGFSQDEHGEAPTD